MGDVVVGWSGLKPLRLLVFMGHGLGKLPMVGEVGEAVVGWLLVRRVVSFLGVGVFRG